MTGDEDDDTPQTAGPLRDARDTVDAGTKAGLQKQKARKKTSQDRADEFWRSVLADPVGRREIWALLKEVGAFAAPFQETNGGFPHAEHTWFHAGRQAFGLRWFMRLMRTSFQDVNQMLREHEPYFQADEARK